ncbi:MAG: hypothetical protein M3367_10350 [Acidobacteriota bacterium]|nr:hypothetical protein [Acidobacteriota bacterium]
MELFDKEIKYVEKYESESNFNFVEASGQWIVYRSEVSSHTTIYHPKLIPTIDLIFVGAIYFELLSRFRKIEISKPNNNKSLELAKKFDKGFEFLESDERVYKIESQNNSFYVVTAHLWIHEHNCQYRESFIDNFNYNNYLKKYVNSWVKIK